MVRREKEWIKETTTHRWLSTTIEFNFRRYSGCVVLSSSILFSLMLIQYFHVVIERGRDFQFGSCPKYHRLPSPSLYNSSSTLFQWPIATAVKKQLYHRQNQYTLRRIQWLGLGDGHTILTLSSSAYMIHEASNRCAWMSRKWELVEVARFSRINW